MEFQAQMNYRQRKEAEARRRLATQGILDPRTGGRCDFNEVRKYDFRLEQEILKCSVNNNTQ